MLFGYYRKLNKTDKAVLKIAEAMRRNYVIGLVTDIYPMHIDDKKQNLVAPKRMGMKTIHFRNARQLKEDLKKLGVGILI